MKGRLICLHGPMVASAVMMRSAALMAVLACAACAQFKSTVPLVVAPVTVTDAEGRFVDGLTIDDLILYDNSVRQPIQMDWVYYPISLVVAVQTSSNAGAVIDKLGGSGILFAELLSADRGETAVISFSDTVRVHRTFTGEADLVTHALRMLRKEGEGACILDALLESMRMLEARPPERRRIVLMIGEKRDRRSSAPLAQVILRAQRMNAQVYWLTFSPYLQPFTVRPKTAEDLKPEAERNKTRPDDTPVPPDLGPGGYIYALGELFRLRKPDLSELFAASTGGRALGFLKKSALEDAIERIGQEVHQQYIVSFQPKDSGERRFHQIRVVIKDRPDLRVRTREGYWPAL